MKIATIARVIDLHKYALENTNIKLDRSVLYSFLDDGLRLIQNEGWKYLEFSNLENVVRTTSDNTDLYNWYLVFDFYISNQKKKKAEEELQKKLDLQLANLMVKSWAGEFNPARGFQRFQN
uniref:hypothetical protein n=1 Tax=Aliarcobacter sp. TaxID=2321116 RepID=UPI004047758E